MLDPTVESTREVELGDAVIMLFDAQPGWPATPADLRIFIASTRETFNRALTAGASGPVGRSLPVGVARARNGPRSSSGASTRISEAAASRRTTEI